MNALKPGFTPQRLRVTRSRRFSASLLNLFTSSSEPQEVFQLGFSQQTIQPAKQVYVMTWQTKIAQNKN